MTRDWNRLQETYINSSHRVVWGVAMWGKALLPADADRTQQLLRQNGHFSVNKGPQLWGGQKQSQQQGMWFAEYRHTLSPSPKMRFILITLKESHKLLAICSSEEQNHIEWLQHFRPPRAAEAEGAHGLPLTGDFWTFSNNNWDEGANEARHTHITSQAWFFAMLN